MRRSGVRSPHRPPIGQISHPFLSLSTATRRSDLARVALSDRKHPIPRQSFGSKRTKSLTGNNVIAVDCLTLCPMIYLLTRSYQLRPALLPRPSIAVEGMGMLMSQYSPISSSWISNKHFITLFFESGTSLRAASIYPITQFPFPCISSFNEYGQSRYRRPSPRITLENHSGIDRGKLCH